MNQKFTKTVHVQYEIYSILGQNKCQLRLIWIFNTLTPGATSLSFSFFIFIFLVPSLFSSSYLFATAVIDLLLGLIQSKTSEKASSRRANFFHGVAMCSCRWFCSEFFSHVSEWFCAPIICGKKLYCANVFLV